MPVKICVERIKICFLFHTFCKNIFCGFFTVFVLLFTQYGKAIKNTYKPTLLKEITKFEDFTYGRYVMGYKVQKETGKKIPMAIYDKSVLGPMDTVFLQKLLLAAVGINDLNMEGLSRQIRKKNKIRKKTKYFRLLFNASSVDTKSIYPENWWKNPNINWNRKCKINISRPAPRRIYLRCIDNFKESESVEKIKSLLQKMSILLYDDLEEDKDRLYTSVINSKAYFERQEDGAYRFVSCRDKLSPPVKVIDLKGKDSSLRKAATWSILTTLSKSVISLIPVYGVPELIVAFMERFYNLIEVQYLIYHARALSGVVEALDGNKTSPFYGQLSKQQLHDAICYLKRSSTLISGIISSMVIKRKNIARHYLQKLDKKRRKSLKYLKDRGYRYYHFPNSYYAIGYKPSRREEPKQLKIFSLYKSKTFRKKPHDVVDFTNPQREYRRRNIMEMILFGSNFLYVPLPLVHSLIKILYKEILIREIHRYQMHESGFSLHLEANEEELKKYLLLLGVPEDNVDNYVANVYEYINKRQLNPLCQGISSELESKLRSERWMKIKDPNYTTYVK
jgi:hypothetical protein